jgi:hypothetical protein
MGPPGPRGAKGAPRCGPDAGTMLRASNLRTCHRKADGSCEGQRTHNVRSQMREIRTSGSVAQKTHVVTSPRFTSEVPIIRLSALLQLVEWCQVRRQRGQQGGPSCASPEPPLSPPAPDPSTPSPRSGPVLAEPDRRIARANRRHAQSDCGPAARHASSQAGGDQ